jgi:hypothetical protein
MPDGRRGERAKSSWEKVQDDLFVENHQIVAGFCALRGFGLHTKMCAIVMDNEAMPRNLHLELSANRPNRTRTALSCLLSKYLLLLLSHASHWISHSSLKYLILFSSRASCGCVCGQTTRRTSYI